MKRRVVAVNESLLSVCDRYMMNENVWNFTKFNVFNLFYRLLKGLLGRCPGHWPCSEVATLPHSHFSITASCVR